MMILLFLVSLLYYFTFLTPSFRSAGLLYFEIASETVEGVELN